MFVVECVIAKDSQAKHQKARLFEKRAELYMINSVKIASKVKSIPLSSAPKVSPTISMLALCPETVSKSLDIRKRVTNIRLIIPRKMMGTRSLSLLIESWRLVREKKIGI